MMTRSFGILAALVLLFGAAVPATAQTLPGMLPSMKLQHKVTVRYDCSGLHVTAIYDNVLNRVSFVWGARDYHLPLAKSADGARYAGPTLQWWEKGDGVTLSTLPDQDVLASCTVRT